jgi:starch-binding outer membrane protein, SusD/RagB family
MNNRIRATVLAAAMIAATGCRDLTEVPSDFVSPENFYQNQADALAAVNAAYATFVNLPSPFSSDQYLGRNFWMLVEYPTEYVTSRLSAANERSLIGTFHAQFNPTHSYLQGYWQAAYAGINRANSVIERVPEVPMNETRRNQIVGEAKFLRALHYYWLAGMFGGVPLKLDETRGIPNETLPRATAAETWAQIEKDLTEAAAVLPQTWPSSDFGRATRGAALTLLAKAYLQSAATVPELRTTNNQKAIDTFRQVTQLGYSPVPGASYRTLFDGSNERANEIIWSIQNIRVSGLGGQMTEWFTPIVSPIVTGAGQQNQFQAERPFYDSYAPTDVRKDGTWLTSFTNAGRTITWAWTSGIQTASNYGSTGPAVRKYIDWAAADDGAEAPDYVILRYADVLLGLAEAINEVSGPTAEAIGLVNQVRTRAGLPNLPAGLTQATFKDAIFLERKYEFAMELHGVFDMRRHWEWAKARVEANMRLARPTSAGGANINASPFTSSVEKCSVSPTSVCFNPISDKWRLYPIPAHAIELNPALTQNPGW